MSLEDTVAQIRAAHRERIFAMEQRKRLNLALGAFVRLAMGWQRDIPEVERNKISRAAAKIIESAGEGTPFVELIAASQGAQLPFIKIEKGALKAMEKMAKTLPVWKEFGEPIRGFGAASLAVITAEAGDLSMYTTHSKLWKRMGLAVMGSIRQGGLGANAKAEDWVFHGYSPKRRSHMWNIGDTLIKGNQDGRYRTLYLRRKEYEIARDPEIKPIAAHRRAQRYMEKALLRDLWKAWRRAMYSTGVVCPIERLPADHAHQEAA